MAKDDKIVSGQELARLRKQRVKREKAERELAEAEACGISVEELRKEKLREVQDIKDRKPVAATAPVPAPDLRHPTKRGKIVWDGYRK